MIFDALQIAVYMGFTDIYLIGVDMTKGVDYAADNSHFYKGRGKKVTVGSGNQESTIRAFAMAYKLLEPRGIRLRNATREVWWDEIPRVDFDSLFD